MKHPALQVGLIAGLAAAVILAYQSFFIVKQTEVAMTLRFGEAMGEYMTNPSGEQVFVPKIAQPGLNAKMPFVDQVIYFDQRLLNLDLSPGAMPTRDQKQIIVDLFAKYHIERPLAFYQAVRGDVVQFEQRLSPITTSATRDAIRQVEMADILTAKRADVMRQITQKVQQEADKFGVKVTDVRIKRLDLPEENSQAIFNRMRTQREQEARLFRAEGEREALSLRAEADKRRTVINAEARKTSDILRGEGDAEATKVYNQAFTQDPEFFSFFRSMQALNEGLAPGTTTYVGPAKGEFFRFFNQTAPN